MNIEETSAGQRVPVRIVAVLTIAALVDHLVAAQLNGGSRIDYTHHMLGFFLIAAVTALPVVAIARFRPVHRKRAWIAFGLIQLLFGIVVVMTGMRDR